MYNLAKNTLIKQEATKKNSSLSWPGHRFCIPKHVVSKHLAATYNRLKPVQSQHASHMPKTAAAVSM